LKKSEQASGMAVLTADVQDVCTRRRVSMTKDSGTSVVADENSSISSSHPVTSPLITSLCQSLFPNNLFRAIGYLYSHSREQVGLLCAASVRHRLSYSPPRTHASLSCASEHNVTRRRSSSICGRCASLRWRFASPSASCRVASSRVAAAGESVFPSATVADSRSAASHSSSRLCSCSWASAAALSCCKHSHTSSLTLAPLADCWALLVSRGLVGGEGERPF
jgi:hypothetical protein